MAESKNYDVHRQCAICLSVYSEPRLLNCFHKFCTPCLEKIVEGKTIFKCPLCRLNILLPRDGVVGFKLCTKSRENNLKTPSLDLGSFCQLCDIHIIASVKCLNCDQYLCRKCHEYHMKVKLLQDHEYEYLRSIELNETQTKEQIVDNIHDCEIHRKELSLFCYPCNKFICGECNILLHKEHEVATISKVAAMQRNLLNAAIGGLKSRIPILKNTVQTVKNEGNMYNDNLRQITEEIKAHSAGLKEIFCKNIDLITNTNLESIDKFASRDRKLMETFIEETETDENSLASMVRNAEEVMQNSSDNKIIKISTNLRRRFSQALRFEPKSLKLPVLQYVATDLNKQQIEAVAGRINRKEEREIKPSFRNLPIPDLRLVKEFKQISSFSAPSIVDLVSGKNATCWILSSASNTPLLYFVDGKQQQFNTKIVVDGNSRLLKKTEGDVFVWSQMSAVRLSTGQQADEDKQFQVDFEKGVAVCFLKNGNLLVYNRAAKIFVEIGKQDGIKRKFQNEILSGMLGNGVIRAVQTKAGNLIIVQNTDKVITVNDKGDIINTASVPSAGFRDVCIDKYENIFMTDYQGHNICLFSPEGVYKEKVLNINYPNCATVDDSGNLWISESYYNNIYKYSFL